MGLPIAAIAAVLWWGPSAGLRYAVRHGLEAAGYRVVELADARVSLIDRRVDLAGLRIEGPGDARLEAAGVELSLGPLLHGRVEVPSLRVAGLALDLARTPKGWRLSGFDVPGAGTGGASPVLYPDVRIGRLEIATSKLVVRDGRAETEVALASAVLEGVDTAKDAGDFALAIDGSIGGRRVAAKGTAAPFGTTGRYAVHLDVDGVDLAPLAHPLGVALAGRLSFSGDLRGDVAAGLAVSGTARLADAAFAGGSAAALSWRGEAHMAVDGVASGSGRVEIDRAGYSAAGMKVGGARMTYEGRVDLDAKGVALSGALVGDALTFEATGQSATVRGLRVDTTRAVFGREGSAAGRLKVALAGAARTGAEGKFAAEAIEGEGDFGGDAGRGRFDGRLTVRAPRYEAGEMRVSADALAGEGVRIDWADGSGQARANLSADGPTFSASAVAMAGARIGYDGTFGWRADGTLAADGNLDVRSAKADLREADARVSVESIGFSGRAQFGSAAPAMDGSLKAATVSVVDSTARELFAAAGIDAGGVAYGSAGLSSARVGVNEPRVLRREKALPGREAFGWRLRAQRAEIEGARVTLSGAAAIEAVRIAAPVMRLTRTKTGFLSFERGAPPVAGATSPPAAPSPGFALGRFEIADGRAIFEDRTPHDTVRLPMDRLALTVRDIDVGRPERPVPVTLAARVGSFGQANVRGAVYPFDERLSFDLDVAVRSVDLPLVSAYFDDLLGVDVRTGTASVDGHIVARQEKLAGLTKWRLANVRIDDREATEGTLARQTGVPVATVLSLLSDGDNNIALDIPVSGELSNPDFDTGDAVRQAVGGALRGALSNTFSVLFPFGSFISAAIDSERRGTGLTLPDVAFAPGDAALDAGAATVVDGLAKLLAARPAARLEVCGFAGPADVSAIPRRPGARPVDEDVLRRLAERRGESVKRRLVEQGGVDEARIFQCRPVVDDEAGAKPRAELRF